MMGGKSLKLNHQSMTPIYMQIAEWIENEILQGHFKVDEKVHSQYQLAELFQINPATAAKGLTLLGQEGILYDRRGLGKFVAQEAHELIRAKRKDKVMKQLMNELIKEARYLNVTKDELISMIDHEYRQSESEVGYDDKN